MKSTLNSSKVLFLAALGSSAMPVLQAYAVQQQGEQPDRRLKVIIAVIGNLKGRRLFSTGVEIHIRYPEAESENQYKVEVYRSDSEDSGDIQRQAVLRATADYKGDRLKVDYSSSVAKTHTADDDRDCDSVLAALKEMASLRDRKGLRIFVSRKLTGRIVQLTPLPARLGGTVTYIINKDSGIIEKIRGR